MVSLKLTYASDVSVEIIASFNKMKELTKEASLVVQAMEKSAMLEVSATIDTTQEISETFFTSTVSVSLSPALR